MLRLADVIEDVCPETPLPNSVYNIGFESLAGGGLHSAAAGSEGKERSTNTDNSDGTVALAKNA